MAYDYGDELGRYALMFGPATCGCVSHAQAEWKLLPYRLQQRFGGTRRGWPACPICAGEGVDPRIPSAVAVPAIPEGAGEMFACR